MSRYSFEAVIFDLDGVITKTALVHARAWKSVFDEYLRLREKRNNEPFREFTHEVDYLTYVDGKPRYDGVRSFLESRGIHIPFGDPSDTPDKETICGIGNKKNVAFLQLIKKQGVDVYPTTIQFIKELKEAGIPSGVISSSKNGRHILQSAGIENLFQTRVDGEVSAQLKLRGKPEGDVFVVAAYNLGAHPGKAVVVEDAISGVQAGRNGGFGLVIGLARKDNEDALLQNGADIAMKDISEIDLQWIEKWFHKKPKPLFKFWEKAERVLDEPSPCVQGLDESWQINPDEIRIRINPCYFRSGKSVFFGEARPAFFLDYDGTLSPIVDRPELAVMSEEMRDVVKRLSKKFTVAIVSGRMREDVEKLIGIEGLIYAGSHGFDISGPGISMIERRAKEMIPLIAETIKRLSEHLGSIKGILIEEKKFSVAVHYRLVEESCLSRIKDCVNEIIQDNKSLRLMSGKKVFEILPAIDWDKGRAVRWITQALGISWTEASVIYIGDDTTDEDAFRVIRTRGTGILVSENPRDSAADFRLSSTEEVKNLFSEIVR